MISPAHQTYNTIVTILKDVEQLDELDSAIFWESAKLSASYDSLIEIKEQYHTYQALIASLNCNFESSDPIGLNFCDYENPTNSYSVNPITFLIEEYTPLTEQVNP